MPSEDQRICSLESLIKPDDLIKEFPLTTYAADIIQQARTSTANILQGEDSRLLVIVGPCSIHDTDAALEYAKLLKETAACFADELFIIMRVYLEKPRSVLGWKGLISDPLLDGSFDTNLGLKLARKILLDINNLGLPAATEFLDNIIPQYLSDLVSWCAIGARTAQSQIHRELASGLSMPVGFKNTTDGNVKIAIDAVNAARHPHHFLGISKSGTPSIIRTRGNEDCHIILRGSSTTPNYSAENISQAADLLRKENLRPRLIVDCSHGNSQKDYSRQNLVVDSIIEQMENGRKEICGAMLESNLRAGKQALTPGQTLQYGQSITDACLSWQETVPLLEKLAVAVKNQQGQNKQAHIAARLDFLLS